MRTLIGTEAVNNAVSSTFRRFIRFCPATGARLGSLFFVVVYVVLTSASIHAQDSGGDGILQASGDSVYRWMIGEAQASLLKGDCHLIHNDRAFDADAILMVTDGPRGSVRTRLVIEGLQLADGRKRYEPTVTTVTTLDEPQIQSPNFLGVPQNEPKLLALLPSDSKIQQTQFQQERAPGSELSLAPPVPVDLSAVPPPTTFEDGATTRGTFFFLNGGNRSVEILSRNASSPQQYQTIERPELGESVVVARGGVTVIVRDVAAQLPGGEVMQLGTVSLSADRIVAWLPTLSKIFSGEEDLATTMSGEIYLEGDIVFRQGERIIYAQRMYYNIAQEKGVVLDAEAIMTIDEYQGIVRLKADVLQQIAKGNFVAFDAAVTTSRLGKPRYWLQSEQLQLTDQVRTATDRSGRPVPDIDPFVSSNNNFVYLGGVPILYWPRFATSLTQPTFYLTDVNVRNDRTFGTQVLLDWDMFQLLGIRDAPKGVRWELSTDYLDERGPALGTNLEYRLPGLFGLPGPVNGLFDTWIIDDDGLDRLGGSRLAVPLEESIRGRSLLRHRHFLPNGFEFIAELGWISDRNFLEQYLENEWDQETDHNTALRLRRYYYNQLFDVTADVQLNDFFTETEELPSFDHYILGASPLRWFTWSAHSRIANSRLNVADPPTDPVQAAAESPLPGEVDAGGLVASTRHEIALPVQTGPIKFVPFVSGEAAYYDEAADGGAFDRLLGQAGLRASLPMSRIDPTIQSSLMNIRGLAHKLEWVGEYFYADSDRDLDELPLYDPLDDNAQEQFRRRFIQTTFGGALPVEFDPRTVALRHGFQRWVTSPSESIADDLQQVRLGLHQRFQTKRGLQGRERIVDLLQLDVDTVLFPDADRDNFGETIGPTTYLARYHIGDRFTLMSDGYFDFFDDGLQSISAGLRTSRPGVSDWYVGLFSLQGPIDSTVLSSSIDYRLSEKWIISGGTIYDFGSTGNVGQTFGFTRIGESMLVRLNLNVDSGRDNVSVGFSIAPRFWPSRKIGRIAGQFIPPPGVEGLE